MPNFLFHTELCVDQALPDKSRTVHSHSTHPYGHAEFISTTVPNNLIIKKQNAANIRFLFCNKIIETIKKNPAIAE